MHHQLLELTQTHVHRVSDVILCCPLLCLPSIFPSVRVFSDESVLCIRWAKYWSFSFSLSPSNEYSGLISFRIDWFDLLAVQGTFKHNHDFNFHFTFLTLWWYLWLRLAPNLLVITKSNAYRFILLHILQVPQTQITPKRSYVLLIVCTSW